MRRIACITACLMASLALAACAGVPSPEARLEHAQSLTAAHGWNRSDLTEGRFTFTTFLSPDFAQTGALPGQTRQNTLAIYIEGDGLAFLTRERVSDDPTPIHPVALELALLHPVTPVAYLARPCQYRPADNVESCDSAFWTQRRYAPEVIESMAHAVDALKTMAGAQRLVLVGFSGGGAVAALIAAQRRDVALIVTVAADVDTDTWTRMQRVSPLQGSLNPADAWAGLLATRQVLFVGANDRVVPREVALSYAARFPPAQRPVITVVPGYDHGCCWAKDWAAMVGPLLETPDAGVNAALSQ